MIKVITRCPYCETTIIMLQEMDPKYMECSCKATRIVRDIATDDTVHVVVGGVRVEITNPHPFMDIPAEEAAARENVASLVNRIAALEWQVNQLIKVSDYTTKRVTALEESQSGVAIARRLGEYMQTASVRP